MPRHLLRLYLDACDDRFAMRDLSGVGKIFFSFLLLVNCFFILINMIISILRRNHLFSRFLIAFNKSTKKSFNNSHSQTEFEWNYYCWMFLIPRLQFVCINKGLVGYWKGYFNHKRSRRRCLFIIRIY